MIAALMIVTGLVLLLVAVIPQTWQPLGHVVRAVNTALAALAVRPFAQLLHRDEDEVQQFLVKAARVALGFLGVVLIVGAATYASTA